MPRRLPVPLSEVALAGAFRNHLKYLGRGVRTDEVAELLEQPTKFAR
jgi:hypothetical protein